VDDVDELRGVRTILLDLTPRQVLRIAGHRLPARYRGALERYRYGAGSFKMDWALSEPIPWRSEECRRAATVHLGGTLDEIAASEHAPLAARSRRSPSSSWCSPPSSTPRARQRGSTWRGRTATSPLATTWT
jgi:phytoene dehydrogenase-like protein